MKKAIITGIVLLTAFINTTEVIAKQDETMVTMTVEPSYTITIPSSLQAKAEPSIVKKERDLLSFNVKATDVVLPGNSFVEVFVHTKNNPNKNVLVNESRQQLNFNFKRSPNTEYGFTGNEQSGSGTWKVAEFHPVTHARHVSEVPVTMTTDDILVTSGNYKNTLVFDISLTADMKEKETITTPFSGVDRVESKDFYVGHEKVVQEAQPKIVEIEYDVIYKDGVEISRKEVKRTTVQEGRNKVIQVGTRTEYDDWLDWTKTLPSKYVIAKDSDFSGTTDGSFRYIGSDDFVIIPYTIKGIKPTSYEEMFGESSVKGVATNYHNVTNMVYMFWNSSATTLDLSSFDTSGVTNMYGMFSTISAITLDLSSFDTSSVTNMYGMFYNSSTTTLDLSSFDTSRVTNMNGMFDDSSAITLDLSSFDTSRVTIMGNMFRRSSATSLDLSNFDTSRVTSMNGMFLGSSAITLDLSNFNTSRVTSMHGMFSTSSAIELDLSSFDISSVTNVGSMFFDSSATTGYARTQTEADFFNNISGKPTDLRFISKGSIEYQWLTWVDTLPSHYVVAKDSDFSGTTDGNFKYIGSDDYVIIPYRIKGIKPTSYQSGMFTGMFANTAVKGVATKYHNVTDMDMMFEATTSNVLDLSHFDPTSARSMNFMFQNARANVVYTGTQADANKFRQSSYYPNWLEFVVK